MFNITGIQQVEVQDCKCTYSSAPLGLGSCWTRIYSEIRGGAKEGDDNYR